MNNKPSVSKNSQRPNKKQTNKAQQSIKAKRKYNRYQMKSNRSHALSLEFNYITREIKS